MKKKLSIISILIFLVAGVLWAADSTYSTKVYHELGGDRLVAASGGSIDVESGGEIDVESGGSLKIAGTAVTSSAAEINKLDGLDAGDILTTTNTKTSTNKTFYAVVISGATLTNTISGGTFTGSTLTSPTINAATLTGTIAGGTHTGATLTAPVITTADVTFAVSSNVFAAGEDWTLSASELKSLLLTVTSGSGTPSIIAPSTSGKVYILRNAANVNVILKRSGGTGITVASGTTAILMDNGTDYVRVTADATH